MGGSSATPGDLNRKFNKPTKLEAHEQEWKDLQRIESYLRELRKCCVTGQSVRLMAGSFRDDAIRVLSLLEHLTWDEAQPRLWQETLGKTARSAGLQLTARTMTEAEFERIFYQLVRAYGVLLRRHDE